MSKRPTLLQHFRSFVYQNNIKNIDTALEYFAVFGGTGWDVDVSKSVTVLIEEKVLRNYESIHTGLTRFTHGNALYHMLLSIIALGEEHEDAVFKKGSVGREKGEKAMDYLEMKSLIKFDLSVEKPIKKSDNKSDRLLFELPFMRFWFGLISLNYKGISQGDFAEFEKKWEKLSKNFSILLTNLLVRDLIKEIFWAKSKEDPIISIGSYYDKTVEIQVLAKRKSGKILAASCKHSNEPAKSHMLTTLKEKCKKAELDISEYVLFSKNGFSDEMEQMKEDDVTLLSYKELASLMDGLTKDDLLGYTNKKY